MQEHLELNETRLKEHSRKIRIFREKLVAEYDRIDDHTTGSVSRELQAKD